MKAIIILPLFLLFSAPREITAQELSASEVTLVRLIMQECGYSSHDDSVRVAGAVHFLNEKYNVRKIRFVDNATGSSHFIGRTMYINRSDISRICDVYTGELPHAAQFAENPVFYGTLAFKDFVRTFFASFFLTKKEKEEVEELQAFHRCKKWKAKLWVAYRRQYHRSGTLEYDAHTLREPEIKQEFYALLNQH